MDNKRNISYAVHTYSMYQLLIYLTIKTG